MAKYIDVDVLIHRLLNSGYTADKATRLLTGIPTADVVEVKHGEWIKKNGIYVCSECDFTCPYDVVGDNIEYWECLYCPHCGAKMDGDLNDL